MDCHLLMNVSKTIQNFPEESPQSVLVLVQAVIYRVPQSAFFTVFHLSSTETMTEMRGRETCSGKNGVLHGGLLVCTGNVL